MLSMFKNKKGFSVLFHGEEEARESDRVTVSSALPRHSAQLRDTAARPKRSEVAQHQCQRCLKRFSALESDDETEATYQCHRCQYPTCTQCREPAAGNPPWVCCVCSSCKSMMWLLERTRAGPMLVTRIVEYCDPRGQRLMRLMFRFTLQQYQSPTPRPSITLVGRASDGRADSGAPSSSRPASQTPPARPTSQTWTSSRLSGERSSARLSHVPPSFSNVRRSSPCTHPKRASLLHSVRRSNSDAALAFDADAGAGAEDAAKENSPAVERGVRGSEVLRRIEEAVGVVEYSPESKWRIPGDAGTEAENSEDPLSLLPNGGARFSLLEDRCTAVADIYSAGTPHVSSVGSTLRAVVVESEAPSLHTRPSGHAAFQREALQPQLASTNCATTPTEGEGAVLPATAAPAPEASWRKMTPQAQERCRLGHSVSPNSSGSGRSASPAPRFPTFGQFLDEHVGMGAGDTHLPRDSNVLVTVSPETENSDEDSGGVIELGGGRCDDRLATTGGKANEGVHTPRGVQPQTSPSTGGAGSSCFRGGRRTSGLSEFTPTRVLDMSSARVTLHHRSSSRRRTTRGSVQEIHAPHLYGNSSAKTSTAGNVRRSGQLHDSPYMYGLPTQFGPHGKPAGPVNGQRRRQNAPLATRTAGRALGSDGRQRLVRQHSRTVAPLQRTASRNNELQRMPSRNGALSRTNSSFAHLTRTASLHGYGASFARTNSCTSHALASTPAERAHLTGGVAGRGRLQRTDSAKPSVTGASYGAAARAAPQWTAAVERTHFGYGTPAATGASSWYSSPLKRTLASLSPLKRTASHVCLRRDGSAPFGRRPHVGRFTRSATTNVVFVRTGSAAAARAGAPPRHAPGAFTRTATGTNLFQRSRGHIHEGPRCRPVPTPLPSSAAVCGSGRGAPRICHRVVDTSPVRRVPTAARTATPTMGRRRFPTSTALSRTATGTRNFERQQSNVPREPANRSPGVVRRTVDPAPALVGATRRKAVGSGLHRTPLATGAANAVPATPRTPRRYIIASVSTAGTPAAVKGGGSYSVSRPVLSSVASSHDSNASGGTAGYSSYTGSAHGAAEKAGVVEAGMGRASGQRCRPLVGATTGKEKVPSHVATLNRRAAAATASAAATAHRRTGRAAEASPFTRQNSRLNF
ncbi:conserved hypothetical protein [Leishmania major strain Friedlin]|uniref:FYVE-type zinc finger domain-containing protein n=1 Tax=Leishmania major TaxID=5664 RepID=Q4QIF6_LEIMA|nr:conserved hypothetical protein [Leishmania major strain Friedlin]CAG9569310.1 hypothetical_protein_-_conserved [Leishmania major strain Friedlin]CAJ02191.1 conserved hypothetical protein [Leishmania major strain Friedlin]|eukprot:XP_001681042.1 conserved hypothetical protein [Leishmania major strain Friedlin]